MTLNLQGDARGLALRDSPLPADSRLVATPPASSWLHELPVPRLQTDLVERRALLRQARQTARLIIALAGSKFQSID
eukprot:8922748-Alexandrium_andersonii.AAC.1